MVVNPTKVKNYNKEDIWLAIFERLQFCSAKMLAGF